MVQSPLMIFEAFKDQTWYINGPADLSDSLCLITLHSFKIVFNFKSFSFSKLCDSFMHCFWMFEYMCRSSESNWKIKLQPLNPCAVKVVQLLRSTELYVILSLF